MGRAPCCDKANVKKGPWSPEEDAKLKSYIEQHGTGGNWISLPQKVGLKRCGKSCRLRWLNYLRPNIKHGGFSEEEDRIILSLYVSIGSRWSIIAAQLQGRTDNDIKNYWNTRLKKKLIGKQRKVNQRGRRLEQEDNTLVDDTRALSGSNVINNHNQITFSMSNTISVPSYLNQTELTPCFNDHSYLRKLLLKVEGNYYDGINLDEQLALHYTSSYPNIPLLTALNQTSYDSNVRSSLAMERIMKSTTNTYQTTQPSYINPQGVGEDMGIFGGQATTFPPELEELMSSNQSQRIDGLDFVWGLQ